MNLGRAIKVYIEARQSKDSPWAKGAQLLRALHRQIGDLPLKEIRSSQVEPLLDSASSSASTRYNKYCILRQFFFYWKVRGEVYSIPLPTPRRSPVKSFVPHIYSRHEIRRLHVAAGTTLSDVNFSIDTETFRVMLLFLYGTGAGLSETLQLERRDVDLTKRRINFRSSLAHVAREIPIGSDLHSILLQYHRSHHRKRAGAPQLFLTKNCTQIRADTASKTFVKVRDKANVFRQDGGPYQPRIQDLRSTFAVHRLTAWLKHGADLGKMIPALSVYLGHHDLAGAERYLQLTPERFRVQLNKVSHQKGKKRWRDDMELMKFLRSL